MIELTDKQKRFAEEYLVDLNATQAALRAGYKHRDSGRQLIVKNHIRDYIAELQGELSHRTGVTQDRIILELARIAFSSGADFAKVVTRQKTRQVWDEDLGAYVECALVEQDVEIVDTETLPPEKRAAISSIKQNKHGIAVESCDKVRALELLGKHLGLFKDRMELSGQLDTNPLQGLTTDELRKLVFKW